MLRSLYALTLVLLLWASTGVNGARIDGIANLAEGVPQPSVQAISGQGFHVAAQFFSDSPLLPSLIDLRSDQQLTIELFDDTVTTVIDPAVQAISLDGSLVAGRDNSASPAVWSAVDGMTRLGATTLDDPLNLSETANDISIDGRSVVGQLNRKPFLWTTETGLGELDPLPVGMIAGNAQAISDGDSPVVVGFLQSAKAGAFRWTSAGGYELLGNVPGVDSTLAVDVSGDGRVVFGYGFSGLDVAAARAIRWTAETGPVDIGAGQLTAASADGRSAIGFRIEATGIIPILWDEDNGMRELADVLSQAGLADEMADWTLGAATGISDDGQTLVGNGSGPNGQSGWVVRLQALSDCDVNANGICDAEDIDRLTAAVHALTYRSSFDLNADRLLDLADRRLLVSEAFHTYTGDANLDGEFTSGDLVQVFQRGQYEDQILGNSGWADGDWNGDWECDSGDLVLAFQEGGYEQGLLPSQAATVPEPASCLSALVALACCWPIFRRTRRA